jgi:hypothetical protein
VIVGADRVAANGDVANKVGTYPLAVLAQRHGIPFVVAAPLSTLDTVVKLAVDPRSLDFPPPREPAAGDAAVVGALATYLIGVLSVLLVLAACFRAISGAYVDQRPGVGESLRYAVERLPGLLGAYLLTAVVVVAGLVFFVLPGVWAGVALAVAFPALLFERLGPARACGRSFELVGGHWWRTFGALLLAFLALGLVSVVAGAGLGAALAAAAPGDRAVAAALVTLLDVALAVVLYPVSAAVLTLLYFDLRVRKEGLDVERFARGMGVEPPPPERWAPPGWLPPVPQDRRQDPFSP